MHNKHSAHLCLGSPADNFFYASFLNRVSAVLNQLLKHSQYLDEHLILSVLFQFKLSEGILSHVSSTLETEVTVLCYALLVAHGRKEAVSCNKFLLMRVDDSEHNEHKWNIMGLCLHQTDAMDHNKQK